MFVVYTIVFYDNSGDSPPQVALFPSKAAAVESVVSDVAKFRSLHEDTDYPGDREVRDLFDGEGILTFESHDGVEYSWKLDHHRISGLESAQVGEGKGALG